MQPILSAKALISKVSKVSLMQLSEQILQILFFIGLARTCELKLMGTYIALTAFWGLGSMMIDFGLNHVLIKESAGKKDVFVISAIAISVKGMGMCLLFISLFICIVFSDSIFALTLVFTIPIIGLRSTGSALSSVIIAQERIFTVAVSQFCTRLLLVCFVWISLWFKSSIEYAVLVHFIVESALLLFFWRILGRPGLHYFKQWNFEKCRQLCKAGVVTGLTTSSILMLLRQPLFWMEYCSSDQAALYGLAVRGIELLLIPVNAALLILLPQAVNHKKRPDHSILSDSRRFSFFQYLKPLFFLFGSIAFFIKIFPPFNIFAVIAPKLAPLDQVVWAVFAAAGFLTIIYSVCFDLFIMGKLHIALLVTAVINVAVAVMFSSFIRFVYIYTLEGSLNILNISLVLTFLSTYGLKYLDKR